MLLDAAQKKEAAATALEEAIVHKLKDS